MREPIAVGAYLGFADNGTAYHPSPQCVTPDNRHVLEQTAAPFYLRCTACGARFALVHEHVLSASGIGVVERPLERV